MKVAVIGAGVSGLCAAHRLMDVAEVTLFEAEHRLGGHTDTHEVTVGKCTYNIDSGFIVFNQPNYPKFSGWLDELGVASQPSNMSFAVSNRHTGLEYGTRQLSSLFCRRRNIVSPRFWRMLADLRSFYAEAQSLDLEGLSLAEMLEAQGYGAGFVEDHLVPMCSALWSVSAHGILEAPAREVIRFMAHHRMLQFGGRPEWRVISNGAQRYVAAFESGFRGSIRRGTRVTSVKRGVNGVVVRLAQESEVFDAAVLACHSDQALALLADPSREEREVLSAIGFSSNRVVLHSDASVMPRRRKAWSSWNALVGEPGSLDCQVTYWMNCLQELGDAQQFFVTLNPKTPLSRVWNERVYAHPRFDRKSDLARKRRDEISGVRNTYYCGAYWGWGFHEDGFTSGLDVAAQIRGAIRVAA